MTAPSQVAAKGSLLLWPDSLLGRDPKSLPRSIASWSFYQAPSSWDWLPRLNLLWLVPERCNANGALEQSWPGGEGSVWLHLSNAVTSARAAECAPFPRQAAI